jgi:hypothetical protein
MFDWELKFMICFGLFFNRLFRLHDPGIMRNELIWANLAHFLSHFFN